MSNCKYKYAILFSLYSFFYISYFFLLRNTKKLPREVLHDTLDVWEKGLNDKKFISGTQIPNLADIVSVINNNQI